MDQRNIGQRFSSPTKQSTYPTRLSIIIKNTIKDKQAKIIILTNMFKNLI